MSLLFIWVLPHLFPPISQVFPFRASLYVLIEVEFSLKTVPRIESEPQLRCRHTSYLMFLSYDFSFLFLTGPARNVWSQSLILLALVPFPPPPFFAHLTRPA